MSIKSAVFIKAVVGEDAAFERDIPHIAFIGRSNVGKSSVINSLTKKANLARTSSFPGRTREICLYLINKSLYFIDLPGYGYAKGSKKEQEQIQHLIYWYLFDSTYTQKKVVLIIDANIGLTENDQLMLNSLLQHNKDIVLVANKIDKLKKTQLDARLHMLAQVAGSAVVIPYSAKKNIGAGSLMRELLIK